MQQNRAWDDGMKWGNRLTASHADKYLGKNKAQTRTPQTSCRVWYLTELVLVTVFSYSSVFYVLIVITMSLFLRLNSLMKT